MSTFVGSAEAARILGVRPATLYAYVSRGTLSRRAAPDGRRSLYDLAEVETLAARGRNRTVPPPPSIDVRVVSAVTSLHETGPRYRGLPVDDLARTASYEQVAELLWTGRLPNRAPAWPALSAPDRDVARAAVDLVGRPGLTALIAAAAALADRHPHDDPPTAARRLLLAAPLLTRRAEATDPVGTRPDPPEALTSGTEDATAGPLAKALASAWAGRSRAVDRPTIDAVERAMVLLADHELTTSTLAARVATSSRPAAGLALATGLSAVAGPLHGGAPAEVAAFLREARDVGAAPAVHRCLESGRKVPGFGHTVYRQRDPRLDPLFDALELLPDPAGWVEVAHRVVAAAGSRVPVAPNVDLGLGALLLAADLGEDAPLFAVARIAGLAAHVAEELDSTPLRYRGLARPPG